MQKMLSDEIELPAIERAWTACQQSGQRVEDHLGGAARMVELGSGAHRRIAPRS